MRASTRFSIRCEGLGLSLFIPAFLATDMARQYTLHRAAPTGPKIDFAAELNPEQLAAVTAPPGPALIIAGAGTGKTRTLTYRVAYLIENGILPRHILLLTFTNKAAREMLDRVAGLVPEPLDGLWGGTFHSIGNRILRRHPAEAGFSPGFSILDREDAVDLMDDVVAKLDLEPHEKRTPKGEVFADVLSYQLNTALPLADVLAEKYPHFLQYQEQFAIARSRYEQKKKEANALDFDDLLEKTVRLFKKHPRTAEQYQRQFQFVLVDEYQDTNHLQNDFVELLAARHKNVMVVGDDAQSIYSWRGADFRNILDFPKRHPNAQVHKIETNYRSRPEILAVANASISRNEKQFPKALRSTRAVSDLRPALVPLPDSGQQAELVAQRILELHEEGMPLEEMAVLYRAHFHSMELQMELTRRGIPFEITSGLRFFEQAHIKDVSAFLKWTVNPRDEVAFKRMVRLLPGIGTKSAETLWLKVLDNIRAAAQAPSFDAAPATPPEPAAAAVDEDPNWDVDAPDSPLAPDDRPTRELPETVANPWTGLPSIKDLLIGLKVPAKTAKAWEQLAYTLDELAPGGKLASPEQMIKSVLDAIYDDYMLANFPNYEARREDLSTLASFAKRYDSPQPFLDQLALMTSLDSDAAQDKDDPERVTLTSVHQAKGLEWRAVFVIWLADGKFPTARSLDNEAAIEEERRLFYVAVTRAKDELYLTYPCVSYSQGYGDPLQRPSRFLAEVPRELLEEWQVGGTF
jgi:DNA helicase II / ATP-dependent DNA helicase PcrA